MYTGSSVPMPLNFTRAVINLKKKAMMDVDQKFVRRNNYGVVHVVHVFNVSSYRSY